MDAPFLLEVSGHIGKSLRTVSFRPLRLPVTNSGIDQTPTVHGALGTHVDDGLAGGDQAFRAKLEEIRQCFDFGSLRLRLSHTPEFP